MKRQQYPSKVKTNLVVFKIIVEKKFEKLAFLPAILGPEKSTVCHTSNKAICQKNNLFS